MTRIPTESQDITLDVRTRRDGEHVLKLVKWKPDEPETEDRLTVNMNDEQLAFLGRVAICRSIEQP